METFRKLYIRLHPITIPYRTGSSRARHRRYKKNSLLRRNRSDPRMEEAARKGNLLVPLQEVSKEWRQSFHGLKQLETAATHCDIFKNLFRNSFTPGGYMGVSYKDGSEVYRGNLLYPRQVLDPPVISLPVSSSRGSEEEEGERLYTLVLTNPDGHLQDSHHQEEVLHWMIANIPQQQGDGPVSSGQTLCPYLPPVPPRGTGVHRMVFTLYSHSLPLPSEPVTDTIGSWLDKRSFSSYSFLLSHPHLTPFTFSFFQTLWDQSVSITYSDVLGVEEPVYGMKKDITPRKLTQMAVREARQKRYVYL